MGKKYAGLYKYSALWAITIALIIASPSISYADQQISSDQFVIEDDLTFDDDLASDEKMKPAHDPFENINRKTFKLNDFLIRGILSPLSKIYDFVIPKDVQKLINNFFVNIKMPKRLVNCAFQGKWEGSGIVLKRFLVNSTVGVAGLFDPATTQLGLERQDEDFGQTLAHWGFGEGSYYVIPLFGPTNTRDVVGFVGDTALSPLFWLNVFEAEPEELFFAMRVTRRVNNFSYNVRDAYTSVTDDAIDPYIALQDAYYQRRYKQIKN